MTLLQLTLIATVIATALSILASYYNIHGSKIRMYLLGIISFGIMFFAWYNYLKPISEFVALMLTFAIFAYSVALELFCRKVFNWKEEKNPSDYI